MARKRMIDPSIWINEDFGTLTNLAKLVFIGLFSIADDEGRGKASPAYIKAVLFPYNDDLRVADIEKALSEISSKMSVIFYSCDENKYYTLTSWNKWQKIDKPSESSIPEYEEDSKDIRLLFDEPSTNSRRVLAPNKKRIEENKNKNRKEENRKKIVEIYNAYCTNLPQVQKITEKREKAIDKFLKEFTEEQFEEICKIANASKFLTGNNDRNWKADFDFMMRTDKATAILEGKYSNIQKGGINDFKELWEEARKENEQNGNNADNNTFSW